MERITYDVTVLKGDKHVKVNKDTTEINTFYKVCHQGTINQLSKCQSVSYMMRYLVSRQVRLSHICQQVVNVVNIISPMGTIKMRKFYGEQPLIILCTDVIIWPKVEERSCKNQNGQRACGAR